MTLLFQGYFAHSMKFVHEICFKVTENKKIVIIYFIHTFGKHATIMSVYLFQKSHHCNSQVRKYLKMTDKAILNLDIYVL